MKYTKNYKTIDEQIDILEKRGLKFKDKNKAGLLLSRYNYFDLINGFESSLLNNGVKGKTYSNIFFEDFVDWFFFDMIMKKVTLERIFDIEYRLRTSIAYHFAGTYCTNPSDTLNYLNPSYYQSPSPIDTNLSNRFHNFDLFRTTTYWPNHTVRTRSFLNEVKAKKEYIAEYRKPPFWVTIKALPLGSLYYLFIFLKDEVKEKVLKDFELELSDAKAFEQALYLIKEMRNQCAHLELITIFKIKRTGGLHINLNGLQDIRGKANLSNSDITYIDILKIFTIFGDISTIKQAIGWFYFKMIIKGRKLIAQKVISKMGRKNIFVWLKI